LCQVVGWLEGPEPAGGQVRRQERQHPDSVAAAVPLLGRQVAVVAARADRITMVAMPAFACPVACPAPSGLRLVLNRFSALMTSEEHG